jgi:hypothetical protein
MKSAMLRAMRVGMVVGVVANAAVVVGVARRGVVGGWCKGKRKSRRPPLLDARSPLVGAWSPALQWVQVRVDLSVIVVGSCWW